VLLPVRGGGLPGFSYLTPSGGVRSLAISRILARYAENLVSHAATLSWLTRLRAGIFRGCGPASSATPGTPARNRCGA
jgi:ABC-type transport system involved in cytochrome bd biosynthesis fused ATPase/permease subunit